MTTNGSQAATSPANPSYLPERYEIRRLGPEHADWAKAIIMHSNIFHSPVWPVVYPEGKTARLHDAMKTGDYLIMHQLDSGMSFGVFDTQYEFKRAESKETGGKLYWDEKEVDADAATLLEQMDFPLVSVALSYDGANPLDMEQIMPLVGTLPLFGTFYHIVEERDARDPASWKAKAPKEVLMRNGTSSRHDVEGAGVMKKLAQWVMREAKLQGYRGIQIECLHDAVTKTWLNPPAPFRGELISQCDFKTYQEEDENGKMAYTFSPSTQVGTKIYVHL